MTQQIDNPHFQFPPQLSADGTTVLMVEQDSQAEIEGCVKMIAYTDVEMREDRIDFGWQIPSLNLMPEDYVDMTDAINLLEPRVTASAPVNVSTTDDLAAGVDSLQIQVNVPMVDVSTQGYS